MCNKPLRVTNPHYIKLADQLGVEIPQFSNQPDYKLQVPCGKCLQCIKKRQQHWFVRAHNIYKRLGCPYAVASVGQFDLEALRVARC